MPHLHVATDGRCRWWPDGPNRGRTGHRGGGGVVPPGGAGGTRAVGGLGRGAHPPLGSTPPSLGGERGRIARHPDLQRRPPWPALARPARFGRHPGPERGRSGRGTRPTAGYPGPVRAPGRTGGAVGEGPVKAAAPDQYRALRRQPWGTGTRGPAGEEMGGGPLLVDLSF